MDTERLLAVHRCDCAAPLARPANAHRSDGAICHSLCGLGGTAHPNERPVQRRDMESQLAFLPACRMREAGFAPRR